MLDASKACDTVQYVKLFKLLLKRKICPLIARFLANLYTNQKARIKWDGRTTQPFSVRNGVKQGGVLSPILFNVYSNELLESLKLNGLGCHVGNIFMAAFAYADDIILLAPSLTSLKRMLKVANDFSIEFYMTFNAAKCKFLVFGRGVDRMIQLTFKGVIMNASNCEIHLGIPFGPNADRVRVDKSINDLYRKTNLLMGQFGHASTRVKYHLFKRFCMPMYGYQMWNISTSYMEKFYTAWRKCIRRLLGIPNRTHNNLVHLLVGEFNINTQIEQRISNFYISLCINSNFYVRTCLKLTLNGSVSSLAHSLRHLNFAETQEVTTETFSKALFISELISMRDRGDENREDLTDIINHLCVE